MAGTNKPKLSGLSFNLFAVIGILVILPLTTAFITNLSNANETEYENVNDAFLANTNSLVYDYCPEVTQAYMYQWVDKGANSSAYYESQMPGQDAEGLSSIWDNTDYFYNLMSLECSNANQTLGYAPVDNNGVPVYGFPWPMTTINGQNFMQGIDIHGSARTESTVDGYTWPGYVQEIGDEFSFRVTENYFKYLDPTRDISSLKFTFVDDDYIFNCDNPIFQDLEYKSNIEFYIDGSSIGSYNNFEFDRMNKYKVRYQQNTQTWANGSAMPSGSNVCMLGFVLEYDFNPFESMNLNDLIRNNFNNLSAVIDVYDLDYTVYENLSVYGTSSSSGTSNQYKPPIPILDDGGHHSMFEVAYVDTTRVNFWLNGGTLVLGVALFALAIASTEYWNPVVNFFKEGKK